MRPSPTFNRLSPSVEGSLQAAEKTTTSGAIPAVSANTVGGKAATSPYLTTQSGGLRPATSLQSYFFPYSAHTEATAALGKPKIQSILKGAGSMTVVVPEHELSNARRLLEEGFRRDSKSVLYLHDEKALKKLQTVAKINPDPSQQEDNPLIEMPGPLGEICEKGGVLLLNTQNIDAGSAEGFNDVSEKAANSKDNASKVRTISLCTKADLDNQNLSPAVMSRAQGKAFVDLRNFNFPQLEGPIRRPQNDPAMKDTEVIDLKETHDWQIKLLGGPVLNGQKWEADRGAIAQCSPEKLIFLKNPGNDPLLEDQVIMWQNRGMKIYFASPPDQEELIASAKNKAPASHVQGLLNQSPDDVHVVNYTNIDDTIDSYAVFRDGKPVMCSALLDQDAAAGKMPVLYVTQSLDDSSWQRLMSHKAPFQIAVAPGVEVPPMYRPFVYRCPPVHLPKELVPFSVPVGFMKSYEPKLVERHAFSPEVKRIYVDARTSAADLLFKLEQDVSKPGRWQGKPQRLLNALRNGENVALLGLEHNPELQQELNALLHPPHKITVNGKTWHFGANGGLTGKLLVLTDSKELTKSFGNSIQHTDPIQNRQTWEKYALAGLCKKFAHIHDVHPHVLPQHFHNVLNLQSILVKQKLTPETNPPFNFSQLETLFRHSIDLPGFNQGVSLNALTPIDAQLLRNVFKDTLIGGPPRTRPQPGSDEPEQITPHLKICLRTISPDQMERMPPRSANIERLGNLLKNSFHEDAILQRPWEFLNCFSRDVICSIVGDPAIHGQQIIERLADKKGLEKEIGSTVLALVMSTAERHGIEMHARLKERAAALQRDQPIIGIGQTLMPYMRPQQRVPRGEHRNRLKANVLLRKSNKVYLKGEPGSGKTHLAKSLSVGEYHAPLVANEGEAAFDEVIDAWLNAEVEATLVIDEVNLLNQYALDRLSELALSGSPKKRIIVTGNDDHFEGRTLPDFVRDAMPTQRCCTLPDNSLYQIFVKPMFAKLQPPVPEEVKLEIAGYAIPLYRKMQSAFPELEQSPRNLAEFTMQLACVMNKKSLRSLDDVKPYMNYIARQAYTNALLEEDDRQAAEMWLNLMFGGIKKGLINEIAPVNLKAMDLADTPDTYKQAQSISWWAQMLDQRIKLQPESGATGLMAKLIQGPAAIGKDTIAEAVLKYLGRAPIVINAKQWNFNEFKTKLAQAIAENKILIVSEMNLLPSALLEGELNTLLTQASSGFGLIGTINPLGYAGRQALSPALLDRMQRETWNDYDLNALNAIGSHLAEKAMSNMRMRLSSRLQPYHLKSAESSAHSGGMRERIEEHEVEELVQAHWDLLQKLKVANDAYLPGVRQLRNALDELAKSPKSRTVKQVFEDTYEFYIMRAAESAQNGAPKTTDTADRLKLYKTIMHLVNSDWMSYPQWKTLPNAESINSPVVYDPATNTMYANPNRAPVAIASHLLQAYNGKLYSPDAQSINVLDSALLESSRAKAERHVGSTDALNTMAPPSKVLSAAGRPPQTGVIGYITGTQSQTFYLPIVRQSAHDELLKHDLTAFPGLDNTTAPSTPQKVELFKQARVQKNGEERMYVGTPVGMRPTRLKINGELAHKLYRDERGGWYVVVPDLSGKASSQAPQQKHTITYGFVEQNELPLNTGSIKLKMIDPEWPEDVKNLIRELSPLVTSMPAQEIARRVQVFLSNFSYSHEDADGLNATPDASARNTHFLHRRKGVCAEFSTATAFIINAIGIPTVCVTGHVTVRGDIPKQSHMWNELLLASGERLTIDHTPSAFMPQTGLAQTLETPQENAQSTQEEVQEKTLPTPSTDAGDQYLTSPSLEDLYASRSTLNEFFTLPLGELGLEYRQLGSAEHVYTSAITSKLDLNRYASRHPEMFIKKGMPKKELVTRSLVLKRPPGDQWTKSQKQFLPLILPLFTLQEQGIKLFDEAHTSTEDDNDIVPLFKAWNDNSNITWPTKNDLSSLGNAQTLKIADARFYDNLVQLYYKNVLEQERLNFDSDEASIRRCIAWDWRNKNAGNGLDLLPMEITLAGKSFTITRSDYEEEKIVDVSYEKNPIKVRDLLDGLTSVTNTTIDMKNSPIVNAVDHLIKNEISSYSASEWRAITAELVRLLDKEEHPIRLQKWAIEKIAMMNAAEISVSDIADDESNSEDFTEIVDTYIENMREKYGAIPDSTVLQSLLFEKKLRR